MTSRVLLLVIIATTAVAGPEIWLTPERARLLATASSRPYVTAQRRLSPSTIVYDWTDGTRTWTTTQAVQRVTGKPAKNAWAAQIDTAERARNAIIDDLSALASKPGTIKKSDLTDLVAKHAKPAKGKAD